MTVRLVKFLKAPLVYDMVVVADHGDHMTVEGPYAEATDRDLGYVRVEAGDHFVEHYWRSRWYSIKEISDRHGRRKGWYCDIARPVEVAADVVISADLDLDVWVSADGTSVLILDEDEFADSGLQHTDPAAASHAMDALEDLRAAASDCFAGILRTPFTDRPDTRPASRAAPWRCAASGWSSGSSGVPV